MQLLNWNFTNNGNISSNGNGVGKIFGGNLAATTSITIKNCSNSGNISGRAKSGLRVVVLIPSVGTY